MLENKQYKLIIAYDGTDFSGWQIQKNGQSIANLIERTFEGIFKKEIHLIGASRTDAGVHAFGQVATFFTDLAVDSCTIQRALNDNMPARVRIRSCKQVPHSFHPRFDVIEKVYHYMLLRDEPQPWQARYGYFHEHQVDVELLQKAVGLFIGTHDFRSFCTGKEYTSTVRRIDSIEILQDDSGATRLTFRAKGFLRYMIRRIVGACIDVASGKMVLDDLLLALEQKNPNQRFMMAPPHGLMLYQINYKE